MRRAPPFLPMPRSLQLPIHRAVTSALLVAALLTALLLAADPHWHHWLHASACADHAHDSSEPDSEGDGPPHECAATLLLAGAVHWRPAPTLVALLSLPVLRPPPRADHAPLPAVVGWLPPGRGPPASRC